MSDVGIDNDGAMCYDITKRDFYNRLVKERL